MSSKNIRTAVALGAVTALGLTAGCANNADAPNGGSGGEVYELRVADWFPTTHPQSTGIQEWMDDVVERSDGRIEFSYYPSEQLGEADDLLSLTTAGTTDISSVGFGYHASALPLLGVGDLPGMHLESCEGTQAYMDLLEDDQVLGEDMRARGVKSLVVTSSSPYELLTSQRVETPQDAVGLKLRSSGGTVQRAIASLNAAPVNLSGPEQYEAIQRGTVDGTVFTYGIALTYSLQEVINYATQGASMGSFSLAYSINVDVWDSLPEDLQQILADAGREASARMCEADAAETEAFLSALNEQGGELVELTDEQIAAFEEQTSVVVDEWAENDVPDSERGRQAIDDFNAAVEAYRAAAQ